MRSKLANVPHPEITKAIIAGVCVLMLVATPISAVVAASPVEENQYATSDAWFNSNATQSVGPEEALEERNRALEMVRELQRLNDDPMVSIDQSTLESVHSRIEDGNISYERAKYQEAEEHWHVASEQAKAALVRHYASGADRYLNATATYLSERRSAGYSSPAMARFSERVQQLRNQEVDSLRSSRDRYEAAQNLNEKVESELPSMNTVNIANSLAPLKTTALVVAGLSLILLSLAGSLGYRYGKGQSPNTVASTDSEEEQETSTTLR